MTDAFVTEELQVVDALLKLGDQNSVKLFVVGGVVRDLMRGGISHDRDLDVVVEGNAIDFAQSASAVLGGTLKKFPDFITAKIVAPSIGSSLGEIDFASTRTEHYQAPGALPTVKLAAIADDLRRRDFSVNAMALPLQNFAEFLRETRPLTAIGEVVIDLFGGANDLAKREVRVLHDRSFIDDPTRLYRACRYATRLEAKLAPATEQLFDAAVKAGTLNTISRFRIATEVRKICGEKNFGTVLSFAQNHGLLAASHLVSEERRVALVELIARLQSVFPDGSDAAFPALLLILTTLHPAGGTIESYLSDFGFGKKKIQAILEDAETLRKISDPGALSDAALAAHGALHAAETAHAAAAISARRSGAKS